MLVLAREKKNCLNARLVKPTNIVKTSLKATHKSLRYLSEINFLYQKMVDSRTFILFVFKNRLKNPHIILNFINKRRKGRERGRERGRTQLQQPEVHVE